MSRRRLAALTLAAVSAAAVIAGTTAPALAASGPGAVVTWLNGWRKPNAACQKSITATTTVTTRLTSAVNNGKTPNYSRLAPLAQSAATSAVACLGDARTVPAQSAAAGRLKSASVAYASALKAGTTTLASAMVTQNNHLLKRAGEQIAGAGRLGVRLNGLIKAAVAQTAG